MDRRAHALRPRLAALDGVRTCPFDVIDDYGLVPDEAQAPSPAIAAAALRRILEGLPQGLQSGIGEGGCLLSGGQGQRVRFGRALMRPQARLVIMDEPFRGIDRTKRQALLQRARQWQGMLGLEANGFLKQRDQGLDYDPIRGPMTKGKPHTSPPPPKPCSILASKTPSHDVLPPRRDLILAKNPDQKFNGEAVLCRGGLASQTPTVRVLLKAPCSSGA